MIHGNRSQSQRVRALADFRAGRATLLIATEVAARGLDVEQLAHVVTYELPMVASDYVHRIGRTGRAGRSGIGISFVLADQVQEMRGIAAGLGLEHQFDPRSKPAAAASGDSPRRRKRSRNRRRRRAKVAA